MQSENKTNETQAQDKQKEIKRKVQFCKMFDVFVKDMKNEDDKNG